MFFWISIRGQYLREFRFRDFSSTLSIEIESHSETKKSFDVLFSLVFDFKYLLMFTKTKIFYF